MKLLQLITLFLFTICFAQKKYVIKDTIDLKERDTVTYFKADENNNLYYISGFDVLKKRILNHSGQKFNSDLLSFSNRAILEKPYVFNPLQITVKAGFFNLIVLDNRLMPLQDPIVFPPENNFTPTLTYLLDTNYLWGYDPILQKLVLWDYQKNQIFRESILINNIESENDFKDLVVYDYEVYLIGNEEIYVFNDFAELKRVISFQEYKTIHLINHNLYFLTPEGKLKVMNLKDSKTEDIPINTPIESFAVNSNFLFVLQQKLVYLYALESNIN